MERTKLLLKRGVLAVIVAVTPIMVEAQRPDTERSRERSTMVDLIRQYGVRDPITLEAMRTVPRHQFVPDEHQRRAYGDHPLPIGLGQTISQPYVVAYMTEMVEAKPGMKVLEVGTGSGYQAAVLAASGCTVYTIEIFAELEQSARERLTRLGFQQITTRHADGHFGWPDEAPFDAIVVTAAAGFIPPALIDQLKEGGRMIIPVGNAYGVQNLILVTKEQDGNVRTRSLLPVRFVPMLSGLR